MASQLSFKLLLIGLVALLKPAAGADFWRMVLHSKLRSELAESCVQDLQTYSNCQASASLYQVCTSVETNQVLQVLLGCSKQDSPDWIQECQQRCFHLAGSLVNETVLQPCSPDMQAMRAFSGNLDLFTLGLTDPQNISHSVVLPLPNMLGLSGAQLVRLGEPGKCAEILSAHSCALAAALPLSADTSITIVVGACLPRSCTESDLKGVATGLGIFVQCDVVRPLGTPSKTGKVLEAIMGWDGQPVEYVQQLPISTGLILSVAVIVALTALVVLGTGLQYRSENKRDEPGLELVTHRLRQEAAQPLTDGHECDPEEGPGPARRSPLAPFLGHWSLLRNLRSLLRVDHKSDLACIDGLRAISMIQVVVGHGIVYQLVSIGITNMEQFSPPDGLLGQFWFMLLPGCFYGVDTFFLLSGFLCCRVLQSKVFGDPRRKTLLGAALIYPKIVLLRWLRLVPVLLFSIMLAVNVMPYLGTGFMWNTTFDQALPRCWEAGYEKCQQNWWPNALCLQNLNQFAVKCAGHLWYVATDMQLYLTAPFFCLAHARNPGLGWALLAVGLVFGAAAPMLYVGWEDYVPELVLARGTFMTSVYMNPICRCPPFLLGIGLAWIWEQKAQESQRATNRACAWHAAQCLLSLFLMATAVFGRYALYQCDPGDCGSASKNPVPRWLQLLWPGGSILTWSLGVALMMHLCFQGSFVPGLQDFLSHGLWGPLAKLSYACYLIHPGVLILDYCQRSNPTDFTGAGFLFNSVTHVVFSMLVAAFLYLFFEKPLANMISALFAGK